MKQALIIILILVVIAGAVYWMSSQETADAPAATEIESVETGGTAEQSTDRDANDYVGLDEAEAEELASQNEVPFRVVERDGAMLPTTRDYREGRINAVVEDELVVSYTVEGEGMESGAGDDATTEETPATTDSNVTGEHEAIIGLTEAEAEAYAEANDVPFRIGSIDGEGQPVTMDYRPGRITASLEGGVVTSYTVE